MKIWLTDIYEDHTQIVLEFLYELMKERDPEINISHSTLPTFEEHTNFFLSRPFAHWLLIHTETGLAGYISATHNNEIGIVLRINYRGYGIGPEAVRQFTRDYSPLPAIPSKRRGCWLANVAPTNPRSSRMFEKLGFKLTQLTYAFEETYGQENRSQENR